MRIYKKSIIVTALISLITIFLSYILKDSIEYTFYYDVFIGIFSGAILTLITSIIGYIVERYNTLETFYIYAYKYI